MPNLDIAGLIGSIARAEDLLARLDVRIAHSPLGKGFIERQHFTDATAALWVSGGLVHIEDLVLHDARMDVRTPTHEVTRAHEVLRTRRRIAAKPSGWALSPAGIAALSGREGEAGTENATLLTRASASHGKTGTENTLEEPDPLAAELAEIDAVLARSSRVLASKGKEQAERQKPPSPPSPRAQEPLHTLLYDEDRDEKALMEAWLDTVSQALADKLPPVLVAAITWDAWERSEPLQHHHWLGMLLASAALRRTGKATAHLPALCAGLRSVPRARRRSPVQAIRLSAFLEAVSAAATAGNEEINRLELARTRLQKRFSERRRNSHMPALVELVLARPMVSVAMAADALHISQRAALQLLSELNIREVTGRGRFRAWGIV